MASRNAWAAFCAACSCGRARSVNEHKIDVIDKVWCETDLIPLDAPASAIHQAADACARECYRICAEVVTTDAILKAIGIICRRSADTVTARGNHK